MGLCSMKGVLPFLGMVTVILAQVSNTEVIKAAMCKGINKYVIIAYSDALSTLIFLLCSLIIHRFLLLCFNRNYNCFPLGMYQKLKVFSELTLGFMLRFVLIFGRSRSPLTLSIRNCMNVNLPMNLLFHFSSNFENHKVFYVVYAILSSFYCVK